MGVGVGRAFMASRSKAAKFCPISRTHVYKTKFLNIHRAGYEYFKDGSVVFSDIFCFGFAVAFPMKNNNNKKKKKMEKMRYLANDWKL